MNLAKVLEITFIEVSVGKPEKLATEFAVKINDRGSLYTNELIKLIKKNGTVNSKIADKIKYGSYIVFQKNQVSVSKDSDEVADLDITVYNLQEKYDKIVKSVKNFYENVYEPKTTCSMCDFCPFNQYCATYTNKEIYRNGDYISYDEKVTILGNSVKVGYQSYKIKTTFSGRRFVNIEGEKFEVKSDYRGLYLKVVA